MSYDVHHARVRYSVEGAINLVGHEGGAVSGRLVEF